MKQQIKHLYFYPALITVLIATVANIYFYFDKRFIDGFLNPAQIVGWLFVYIFFIGAAIVYYRKELSEDISSQIGKSYAMRGAGGFAVLIPLLLIVWGHSVLGISLEIVIVLSIVFDAIYLYVVYMYLKKDLE